MPKPAGWSRRTTCIDCKAPTDHTHRCGGCLKKTNGKRGAKRAAWAEEGRCVTCSRIVLEENPRTGELYKCCKVCRTRKRLKGMGLSTEEINRRLRALGGKPPGGNARP
jgi:hypothetical protein